MYAQVQTRLPFAVVDDEIRDVLILEFERIAQQTRKVDRQGLVATRQSQIDGGGEVEFHRVRRRIQRVSGEVGGEVVGGVEQRICRRRGQGFDHGLRLKAAQRDREIVARLAVRELRAVVGAADADVGVRHTLAAFGRRLEFHLQIGVVLIAQVRLVAHHHEQVVEDVGIEHDEPHLVADLDRIHEVIRIGEVLRVRSDGGGLLLFVLDAFAIAILLADQHAARVEATAVRETSLVAAPAFQAAMRTLARQTMFDALFVHVMVFRILVIAIARKGAGAGALTRLARTDAAEHVSFVVETADVGLAVRVRHRAPDTQRIGTAAFQNAATALAGLPVAVSDAVRVVAAAVEQTDGVGTTAFQLAVRAGAPRSRAAHDLFAVSPVDTAVRLDTIGMRATASEVFVTEGGVVVVGGQIHQIEDGRHDVHRHLHGAEVVAFEVDVEIAVRPFAFALVIEVGVRFTGDGEGKECLGQIHILRDDLQLDLERDGLVYAVLHAQDARDLIEHTAEPLRFIAEEFVAARRERTRRVEIGVDRNESAEIEDLLAPAGVLVQRQSAPRRDGAGRVVVIVSGDLRRTIQTAVGTRDAEDEIAHAEGHTEGLRGRIVLVHLAGVIEIKLSVLHDRTRDAVKRRRGLTRHELANQDHLAQGGRIHLIEREVLIDPRDQAHLLYGERGILGEEVCVVSAAAERGDRRMVGQEALAVHLLEEVGVCRRAADLRRFNFGHRDGPERSVITEGGIYPDQQMIHLERDALEVGGDESGDLAVVRRAADLREGVGLEDGVVLQGKGDVIESRLEFALFDAETVSVKVEEFVPNVLVVEGVDPPEVVQADGQFNGRIADTRGDHHVARKSVVSTAVVNAEVDLARAHFLDRRETVVAVSDVLFRLEDALGREAEIDGAVQDVHGNGGLVEQQRDVLELRREDREQAAHEVLAEAESDLAVADGGARNETQYRSDAQRLLRFGGGDLLPLEIATRPETDGGIHLDTGRGELDVGE